jgi:hypothetical protein
VHVITLPLCNAADLCHGIGANVKGSDVGEAQAGLTNGDLTVIQDDEQ